MLRHTFPDLRVVDGTLDGEGPSTPELAAAIDGADVLMHGSGADAFQSTEIDWWREHVGRPYEYFGVTVDPLCPPTMATLPELTQMVDLLPPSYLKDDVKDRFDSADFVYCRETLTLATLRGQKITGPDLAFGPEPVRLRAGVEVGAGRCRRRCNLVPWLQQDDRRQLGLGDRHDQD